MKRNTARVLSAGMSQIYVINLIEKDEKNILK